MAGTANEPGAAPHERSDDGSGDEATELYDLRVVVDRIEGRSVCGLSVGDYFELTDSAQVRIPDGKHFCIFAMAAAFPLLPAKQRDLPEGDWMSHDFEICCPDPDERVVMRIERTRKVRLRTDDLI